MDEPPGRKRKDAPLPTPTKTSKKVKRIGPKDDSPLGGGNGGNGVGDADRDGGGDGGASRPKRTRTGCLTCRERHLKCDEGLPHCNNCKKSNRQCKRGIRLNFLDTQVEQPPRIVSRFGTADWRVEFEDESRAIASEYQGGAERYRSPTEPLPQEAFEATRQQQQQQQQTAVLSANPVLSYEYNTSMPTATSMPQQPLPPIQGIITETQADTSHLQDQQHNVYDPQLTAQDFSNPQPHNQQGPPRSGSTNHSHSGSNRGMVTPGSVGSFSHARVEQQLQHQDAERKDLLDNAEETLFMQVFVEEVGLWMDSMDPQKHFSRLLPFHSLTEPMLLNAFLACGARHLTLVNPAYNEEKALHYYDTATRYLLQALQNPERDTVVCATTAVILNVYEIMSERATQRMNHIAGARALIKECGWNARAQGIGSACFWLNVGLEVLSCLHFNWQVAWNPDEWGVDMDFSREVTLNREEVWTHRMLYLIAKVCNFRATIPRQDDSRGSISSTTSGGGAGGGGMVHDQQRRLDEWTRLRSLIDAWNDSIPRTMHPMAYLHPHQTSTKSNFPEIWLVKRSTIVARLFYHTAMLLLAQTHPFYSSDSHFEMNELKNHHAITICGIAAHVKDRGVASVAIRSLAHAGEVLTERREQEEVIRVFEKINKDTGWRIGFVYKELKEKWGWNRADLSVGQFRQTHAAARLKEESSPSAGMNSSAMGSLGMGLGSPTSAGAGGFQQQHSPSAHLQQLQVQAQAAQGMHQLQQHHQQQNFAFGNNVTSPHQQQHHQQQPFPPPPPPSTSAGGGGTPTAGASSQQSGHSPTKATSAAGSAAGGGAGGMPKRMPQGITNPLYAKADFSLPQHPYQQFYVAPSFHGQHGGGLGGGSNHHAAPEQHYLSTSLQHHHGHGHGHGQVHGHELGSGHGQVQHGEDGPSGYVHYAQRGVSLSHSLGGGQSAAVQQGQGQGQAQGQQVNGVYYGS